MAGLREKANIWRFSFPDDNDVGGAVSSGTLQYANVMSQMDAKMPSQILLQQGLETLETFTAIVIPGTMTIYERDEYEPVFPYNHPYYGQRFRITGVTKSVNMPFNPNNYMVLTMTRSIRAHARQ